MGDTCCFNWPSVVASLCNGVASTSPAICPSSGTRPVTADLEDKEAAVVLLVRLEGTFGICVAVDAADDDDELAEAEEEEDAEEEDEAEGERERMGLRSFESSTAGTLNRAGVLGAGGAV